jgi:RND family efflux transporter MFP subunit
MRYWKSLLAATLFLAGLASILAYNKSIADAKATPPAPSVPSVVVMRLAAVTPSDTLALVGAIEAANDVPVTSETQGRITKVLATTGAVLRSGEAIVQVDTHLKQATLMSAEAAFSKAKQDAKRYEELHAEGNASAADVENFKLQAKTAEAQYITAKRQLDDATIRTPISGTLTERPVNVGMMVQPGTIVGTVVDISTLKLRVAVNEATVLKLRVGAAVPVMADVHAGVVFHGTIRAIAAKADNAGSYPVEISFPNSAAHPLKAGMTARAVLATPSGYRSGEGASRSILAVPRLAVVKQLVGTSEEQVVFVEDGGTARARVVKLGAAIGENVEILSGLQAGQNIVVQGQNLLRDGMKVAIVGR